MRCLIVEDDLTCQRLLQLYLCGFADCVVASNGHEAVRAFTDALDEGQPYDLVCLDIMMPGVDGRATLAAIRQIERSHGIGGLDGVKVIMTTALDDSRSILGAFRIGCEAYLIKPITKEKLMAEVEALGLGAAPQEDVSRSWSSLVDPGGDDGRLENYRLGRTEEGRASSSSGSREFQ